MTEAVEEEREQDAEEHAAWRRDGDAEGEGGIGAAGAVERRGGSEDQQRRGVSEPALALRTATTRPGMLTPRIAVAAAAGGATMATSGSAALSGKTSATPRPTTTAALGTTARTASPRTSGRSGASSG